jgi:hypothetical protein
MWANNRFASLMDQNAKKNAKKNAKENAKENPKENSKENPKEDLSHTKFVHSMDNKCDIQTSSFILMMSVYTKLFYAFSLQQNVETMNTIVGKINDEEKDLLQCRHEGFRLTWHQQLIRDALPNCQTNTLELVSFLEKHNSLIHNQNSDWTLIHHKRNKNNKKNKKVNELNVLWCYQVSQHIEQNFPKYVEFNAIWSNEISDQRSNILKKVKNETIAEDYFLTCGYFSKSFLTVYSQIETNIFTDRHFFATTTVTQKKLTIAFLRVIAIALMMTMPMNSTSSVSVILEYIGEKIQTCSVCGDIIDNLERIWPSYSYIAPAFGTLVSCQKQKCEIFVDTHNQISDQIGSYQDSVIEDYVCGF